MENEVENKGAPASETQAPAGSVETPESGGELDYKSLYFESLETNVKLEKERDNYKEGLLKAKGKVETEDPKKVENKLQGQINFLQEQIKSMQNGQATPVGAGGTQVQPPKAPDHGWSDNQVADLKKKFPGWTDADVKLAWQNHQKNIKR